MFEQSEHLTADEHGLLREFIVWIGLIYDTPAMALSYGPGIAEDYRDLLYG